MHGTRHCNLKVFTLLQSFYNKVLVSEWEKRIPKIDNLFTAAFFLYTLKFGEAAETFVGEEDELFPSDWEDESTAEDLPEESET